MRKVKRFGLTLSQDDRQLLEKLSNSDDDMPIAAFVRRLIRHEAWERGLLPNDVTRAETPVIDGWGRVIGGDHAK
jgi:hypothetical protein